MTLLQTEGFVSFAEAAKLFPQISGKPIPTSALRRWAVSGVRGVRLETAFIGGKFCTSKAAVGRFLSAINEGTNVRDRARPAGAGEKLVVK